MRGCQSCFSPLKEFDLARIGDLSMTAPNSRSVFAIVRRNMDVGVDHDLGTTDFPRLPLRHPLGLIQQLS